MKTLLDNPGMWVGIGVCWGIALVVVRLLFGVYP